MIDFKLAGRSRNDPVFGVDLLLYGSRNVPDLLRVAGSEDVLGGHVESSSRRQGGVRSNWPFIGNEQRYRDKEQEEGAHRGAGKLGGLVTEASCNDWRGMAEIRCRAGGLWPSKPYANSITVGE